MMELDSHMDLLQISKQCKHNTPCDNLAEWGVGKCIYNKHIFPSNTHPNFDCNWKSHFNIKVTRHGTP